MALAESCGVARNQHRLTMTTEEKNAVIESLNKIEADYKALPTHDLGYVITHVVSDNPGDKDITHNYYFSLTIPKPQQP